MPVEQQPGRFNKAKIHCSPILGTLLSPLFHAFWVWNVHWSLQCVSLCWTFSACWCYLTHVHICTCTLSCTYAHTHTHVYKRTTTSCLLLTQGELSSAGLSLITLVSWPIRYQYSLYTWCTVELYYWSLVHNEQKVTIREAVALYGDQYGQVAPYVLHYQLCLSTSHCLCTRVPRHSARGVDWSVHA